MRLINFLPWREALYHRRRKHFVVMLMVITGAAGTAAFVSDSKSRQQRVLYDKRMADTRALLTNLEHDFDVLRQASVAANNISQKLNTRLRQWKQQQDWQQVIDDGRQLAADTHLSEMRFTAGELVLSGHSDLADPVQRLIRRSPQWQLLQFELHAQNRIQFTLSRNMQADGDS